MAMQEKISQNIYVGSNLSLPLLVALQQVAVHSLQFA
jgi:hypothetical protein